MLTLDLTFKVATKHSDSGAFYYSSQWHVEPPKDRPMPSVTEEMVEEIVETQFIKRILPGLCACEKPLSWVFFCEDGDGNNVFAFEGDITKDDTPANDSERATQH